MDLPPLSFVDVETTGLNSSNDRIIEVGIVRVEKGLAVKKFTTLIHPQIMISPIITQITGIADEDLSFAPTFADIGKQISDILANSVFVAHNVLFDYSFLTSEFEHTGMSFSSQLFCTVALSRTLFPQFTHHSLDNIITRFGISPRRRHRAFDDALVLWDFFKSVQKLIPKERLEGFLSSNFI